MKIFKPKLRTLAVGALAALATVSMAQTYTETTYSFTHTPHHDRISGSSFTSPGGVRTWTVSANSFFSVTGNTDDTPPWRLLFAHLAYNSWTTTQGFSHSFTAGDIVWDVVDYYFEQGTDGLTPNTGGGEKLRYLTDLIVNYLTWELGNPGSQPGAPGGGP